MSNKKIFILKKDLPGLPNGRKFKTTYDGKHVYSYLTDDEFVKNELNFYKYPISLVEQNVDWFEEEKDGGIVK